MDEGKDENKQSLTEDLETCAKERDEALSKLKSSARNVYILSFIICIVAARFAATYLISGTECDDKLIPFKEKMETVQKLANKAEALYEVNEQCMKDVSTCNTLLEDVKQNANKQNIYTIDKSIECNDKLSSTEALLEECNNANRIKEEEYNNINDKLETCKHTESSSTGKQQNKSGKKLKKCLKDMESINKYGVHVVKGQVLQVIPLARQWRNARLDCQERGGDLHVPRNAHKLAEYMAEKVPEQTEFWIGISDTEKPEVFQGLNGGRVHGGWEERNELIRATNSTV
ncbi:unnamed protein product, partial [Meganyctiphanes norvegica]